MPYVFVSTQIRLETGPTTVGDEWSDKELMDLLGATLVKALGNNFSEYQTEDPPRLVLNKLEQAGYRLVTTTGVGQTCIWTMFRES
ncbi:GTP cyclohydrolase 1 feedback regulatory protein-like [Mya arenaria]|uniref:GTP cyclohydrolase 1 feedback regulatory protein-like n=1 Tax=Mya arenaria TaxID=6604 RepID=UPI0022E0EFB8|nr:GTP cyclohydrolase 1 feedback regulatory protein-like [Mya arenaria]